MENKKHTPALRFRGFDGPWVKYTLGELGTTYNGLNGKTKEDFGHGAGKFVTYLNIFNHPVADLKETESVELDDTQNQVKYGDIFFTTSSETPDEVGMSSVWLGRESNVYLNSFCFGYRPEHELYPYFMAYLLRSPVVRKKFIFLAQGISRYNISKNKVMDMQIFLPPLEEQKEIGKFFADFDEKIFAQEQKIKKAEQFRRAMLSKLFPAEGASEPALRFRGFSGPWRRYRLKDVATFLNGRAYARDELLAEGKYKVLRVGNFYTNDVWYYSNLELGEKYYADTGDLLYTWSATFGPHIWKGGKVIYHYHIWKVELSEKLDKLFALQLLQMDKDALLSETNGSTMVHITKAIMENRNIIIPEDINEQKQIGDFFYQLDSYISLQKEKREKLRRLKAALLEKLFV